MPAGPCVEVADEHQIGGAGFGGGRAAEQALERIRRALRSGDVPTRMSSVAPDPIGLPYRGDSRSASRIPVRTRPRSARGRARRRPSGEPPVALVVGNGAPRDPSTRGGAVRASSLSARRLCCRATSNSSASCSGSRAISLACSSDSSPAISASLVSGHASTASRVSSAERARRWSSRRHGRATPTPTRCRDRDAPHSSQPSPRRERSPSRRFCRFARAARRGRRSRRPSSGPARRLRAQHTAHRRAGGSRAHNLLSRERTTREVAGSHPTLVEQVFVSTPKFGGPTGSPHRRPRQSSSRCFCSKSSSASRSRLASVRPVADESLLSRSRDARG